MNYVPIYIIACHHIYSPFSARTRKTKRCQLNDLDPGSGARGCEEAREYTGLRERKEGAQRICVDELDALLVVAGGTRDMCICGHGEICRPSEAASAIYTHKRGKRDRESRSVEFNREDRAELLEKF
jgi:hypothetical protein